MAKTSVASFPSVVSYSQCGHINDSVEKNYIYIMGYQYNIYVYI